MTGKRRFRGSSSLRVVSESVQPRGLNGNIEGYREQSLQVLGGKNHLGPQGVSRG